ncbi:MULTISPECIES: nucleotidyltransferase [unclassified Tychonema]|uniref:nucleotidyltransferase n=2 Tax=Tychonema TaxID=54312 RepID=UPI001D13ED51|nr:nucleotidyltransferase [Tychonema sp. LEGE 07199]
MNMQYMQLAEQRRKIYLEIALRRCRPGSGSSLEFLKKRTWNTPVTNIKAIITQTQFVVVGGIATRLYMPERMTDDLDILVLTDDAENLYQELAATGSIKVGELSIGGSSWQLPDGSILDVLESQQPWVTEAIANPNIAPDNLPIIRLPYLIVMKLQASRGIDMGDLTRMLGGADETALELVRKTVKTYLPDAVEDLESLIVLGKLEMGELR